MMWKKQGKLEMGTWLLVVVLSVCCFLTAWGDVAIPDGDVVVELSGGVKMVLRKVPKGRFTMGSIESRFGNAPSEMEHRVTLTMDFWLGEFEVTQSQYEALTGANPSRFKRGGLYPVENISWADAMSFCKKLTEQERKAGRLPAGYEYSLPTEAQWEYAANGGPDSQHTIYSGSDNLQEVGWYYENSGSKEQSEERASRWDLLKTLKSGDCSTHPVGRKKANALGLYDMNGNVWEWCRDVYDFNWQHGDAPETLEGMEEGDSHTIRGGCWAFDSKSCRNSFRCGCGEPGTSGGNGFRVALVAVASAVARTAAENKKDTERNAEAVSQKVRVNGDDQAKILTLPGGVELKLVKVQAGGFIMGSPDDELGRYADEKQHQVKLTKDFWLGKFEVTQAQYEAVMGTNPSRFKKGGYYPVENVSWDDAMAFCKKLTELERAAGRLAKDLAYSLPTEAQWEYACRAGTTMALNSGRNLANDNFDCGNLNEIGWYDHNHLETSTHPVGEKKMNRWGLYDMHGNVWEWCRDWYGEYSDEDVTDPQGPQTGSRRVFRGGAWNSGARSCRAAQRDCNSPAYRYFGLGFRIALISIDDDRKVVREEKATSEGSQPEEIQTKTVTLPGGVLMKFVEVKAGYFINKSSHRLIRLKRNYWIGQYEVTQEQYEAVMGVNPSEWKYGGSYAVENVSWLDAMAFCRKLTELERKAGRLPENYEYSLPTEAQWEFAARGGNKSKKYKYSGGNNLYEVGWYSGNSILTFPVGKMKMNELGLYDMTGNVWEWCRDVFNYDWDHDPETLAGQKKDTFRAIRGGSRINDEDLCLVEYRSSTMQETDREDCIGFRVALVQVE